MNMISTIVRRIPGEARRQSPNRQSIPSAHRNRAFSATAAVPGKNILNTAISSLFSLALRIRSAPTVFDFKFNRDENSDDKVAILCMNIVYFRIRIFDKNQIVGFHIKKALFRPPRSMLHLNLALESVDNIQHCFFYE